MIESKGELKYCPWRIRGETRKSLTVEGESTYAEYFMPCMKGECMCYQRCRDYESCYRENIAFERNASK